MINKIIDGISRAIFNEFGENYEIYTEEIEQGLQEPCFSIECISPTNRQFSPRKYYRTHKFCIYYFPSTKYYKSECNEVLERLYDCLEYIDIVETINEETVTSKARGTEMSREFSDNVMLFFVNYDMYVINKNTEDENITSYSYNSSIKEN